ncbi:hypothetical protein BGX33_005570 [Mortierella sp. NVP41]|nr:hypothetical protein BGX33_005570 [Mortierella sp. NVP41]
MSFFGKRLENFSATSSEVSGSTVPTFSNHGKVPFEVPPLNDHFVEVQPPAQPVQPVQSEPLTNNTFTSDGTLEALKLPDEHHNTILDFSCVRVSRGHVRIPIVPVSVIVGPSNNETVDDTARIQAAIDQVSAQPLEPIGKDGAAVRGAVLLKAGVYRVVGALIIHVSGVVLGGEGQDEAGTTVVATGAIQRDFILVNGMLNSEMGSVEKQHAHAKSKEMMPTNGYRGSKRPTTATMAGVYIPVGETHIPVNSIEGFNIGDRIVSGPQVPPAKIYELIYKNSMISDVGVENMRLLSEGDPTNAEDESHGWYALVMDSTLHGWVADVTTMRFVGGIFASTWSRYVTIQDCSVLYPVSKLTEGGRRYQFCLNGQMGLVKRCFTNNARHDFITLARPNVFVDSTGMNANNDTGPHERWAMGTLYDNITCNTINVRQRFRKGTGQGWSGAHQAVYNCTAMSQNSWFRDAPGPTNWIIGFKGGQTQQPEFEAQSTNVTAANATVEPRSLYWAQLVARVGDVQLGEAGKRSYPPPK